MAIVAASTFGASIGGVLDSPERYGWSADRALVPGAGYITIPPAAAAAIKDETGIETVSVVAYAPVELGDRSVSAMGVDPANGQVAVTILDGRLPETGEEVALAVGTARDLGAGIGDDLPTTTEPVTVVGIAALPAIGLAGVSHPSMAQGVVFTPEGVTARNGAAFNSVAFVDFDGGDDAADAQRAREALAGVMEIPVDAVVAYDALLPAELVEVDSARSTAGVLIVVLGGAAALTLAVTMGSSVRRRRGQLATLAAIGFDGRDLRRSVRCQAGAVAVVALTIGLPLGVVTGRLLWSGFAWQVGVAPSRRRSRCVLGGRGRRHRAGRGPRRRPSRTGGGAHEPGPGPATPGVTAKSRRTRRNDCRKSTAIASSSDAVGGFVGGGSHGWCGRCPSGRRGSSRPSRDACTTHVRRHRRRGRGPA